MVVRYSCIELFTLRSCYTKWERERERERERMERVREG
jgi:hypothetical protein